MADRPPDATSVVNSSATVSDKIRALDAAGYPRAAIARMLNKRYQHVRNVLEADAVKRAAEARPAAPAGVAGSGASFRSPTAGAPEPPAYGDVYRLTLEPGGVVRLPAAVVEALGLHEGGVVVSKLGDEVFTLLGPREAMRRARAGIPQWRPGEPMWSEELIADRRREAAREESDG